MGRPNFDAPEGLLDIEDCIDAHGDIALPPGTTLISLIERNVANIPDTVAYRFLDFARAQDRPGGHGAGDPVELTWAQLDVRMRAVAARIQQATAPGDRVAILAPQGLDWVVAFFAALKAGVIAVPLFAPELPGHAERLTVALTDAQPAVLLTTGGAVAAVDDFLQRMPGARPPLIIVDEVPDAAGAEFTAVDIGMDDVAHLQYTSGATRPPAGVEITHRAFVTNLTQMILSIDLLNRNTHGVSWLPLYHDMGLSMVGFPATYGGHSTLMAPTAFVRRPQRWIRALSDASAEGRVVTAAPNFAYEWAAQRGRPDANEQIDLANVVMIIGSEPVSMAAIEAFEEAFTPYGLPPTAIKPSYGIAEATLFIANIAPDARATAWYFDGERLAAGQAVVVAHDAPGAVAHVSCGVVARSLRAVVVDPATGAELPDGSVGEFWLHGDNVGRGYWRRPQDTRLVFGARLASRLPEGSRAEGVAADAHWLRTGDLGMFVEGELFVTGRIADMVTVGGRRVYPQEIEATVADASTLVRRGYVAAVSVPADGGEHLVILAERATGTSRTDPGPEIEAIHSAVSARHGLDPADVAILPAGSIPRTTSGKLARWACRAEYLAGSLKGQRSQPTAR